MKEPDGTKETGNKKEEKGKSKKKREKEEGRRSRKERGKSQKERRKLQEKGSGAITDACLPAKESVSPFVESTSFHLIVTPPAFEVWVGNRAHTVLIFLSHVCVIFFFSGSDFIF